MSAAGITCSVVDPETLPEVAVMVEFPGATPAARPVAAFTVADGVAVHVTLVVRFAVLESEKVPVATNCCVAPT
jgi:hypothetical protein